jgi:hypothetical protein
MSPGLLLRTVALASIATLMACSSADDSLCGCPDAGAAVEVNFPCDKLVAATSTSCDLVDFGRLGGTGPVQWFISLNLQGPGTADCHVELTFASGATYSTVVQVTRTAQDEVTASPSTIRPSLTCPPTTED